MQRMTEKEEELILNNEQKREETIQAIREWLNNHEDSDTPFLCIAFAGKGKLLSPRELLEDIESKTALAEALVDIIILDSHEFQVAPVSILEDMGKASQDDIVKG